SANMSLASAPTSRLGATGERDEAEATWLHADPVRLETSTDGLILRAARRWSTNELDIVGKLFTEHLRHAHMSWHVAGGQTFIRSASRLQVRTVSPRRAANRSLRDLLPSDGAAPLLRRVMTELQMLIHEKFADQSAPNAVWLWGAGSFGTTIAESSDGS